MNVTVPIGLMLLVFMSGCSDPRDANKSNITNSLNNYLKETKLCISNRRMASMPALIGLDDTATIKLLDYFTALEFLTKTIKVEEVQQHSYILMGSKQPMKKVKLARYVLTEKGKQKYKLSKGGFLSGNKGSFCYGYAEVNNIIVFSEPADFFGKKVIEVKYTATIVEHDKWIEDKLFKKYRSVTAALNSAHKPMKKKSSMVLTNNGWVRQSMF